MNSRQIAHTKGEALYETNFEEHDFVHQLSQLHEEHERGEIETEELADEITQILVDAELGEQLTEAVKQGIINAFKGE